MLTESNVNRSVLPGNPTSQITSYALSGSKTGELSELKIFANLTNATVNLETGIWNLKLEARNSNGTVLLVAEKSVTITTSATINFSLIPLTNGGGDINLELSLPTGHFVASVETLLDNVLVTPALVITNDKISYTKTGLSKGEYLLVFKLKDISDKIISVVSEIVTVKPNLNSSKTITLTSNDFNSKPSTPTELIATYQTGTDVTGKVKLNWIRNSKNETGFIIIWNDGSTTGPINILNGLSTYTWIGATRGKSYTFTIKSTNDFGSSNDSISSTSVTIPTLSTWTVTFNTNGGSAVSNITAENSYTITKPSDPTKLGYDFNNWYKEVSLTNIWDFATDIVTSNTTLYAKWTPTNYSIVYTLDGGTNGANPSNYNIESTRIVFSEPTHSTKVFGGWFTEASFTNSITDIPAGSTGNKTLYAKWRNPIEPNQENQPGGEVKIPSVPDGKAYWLAPFTNNGNWDVGKIGNFAESLTMTTASETGLTSIATPVTPGTYYLYYVVRDTKEILSISANYLTVLGDNVPFYYNGEIYAGFLDTYNTDWLKVSVKKTDLLSGWSTVGNLQFSNEVHKAPTNLGGTETPPIVAVNKSNGDIWVIAHKTPNSLNYHCLEIELWQYTSSWTSQQTIAIGGYEHSMFNTMIMNNDASAMYISRTGWRLVGDWPLIFDKRTGDNFNTSQTITGYAPTVVKMGGNYLYMISQSNDFYANDDSTHTTKLSTHTGINVKKYDTTKSFNLDNMPTLGNDKFNVAGVTKYYAFKPEMYIEGNGTPYIVFVEPTTYEHCRHKGNDIWQNNGWNDKYIDPKLTVMKYDGADWIVVGSKLFSPIVYKTTSNAYNVGTETLRTGYNAAGENDFTTTDTVYTPGICLGNGKIWVVSTDSSDRAFICMYDGTNWSTVKTNFATGVRNPKLVYDNGKLYILYTKFDGSGNETYTYIP